MTEYMESSESNELYVRLAELVVVARLSNRQCADSLNVSMRTIQRWRNDPAYKAIEHDMRARVFNEIVDNAASRMHRMIDVLTDIAENGKSDIARVRAAEVLGRWVGLDSPRQVQQQQSDDRLKVVELLLEQRRSISTSSPIVMPPPTPGGLLPPGYRTTVVADHPGDDGR